MANNRSSSIEESKISKQVTKGDLLTLLKNAHAYIPADVRVARFFHRPSSVRKLEKFVKHDLRDTPPYQLLSKIEIDSLIQMLQERFYKKIKKRTTHDYRHAPNEFANKIFRQLARLISDDPRILALVQAYSSDQILFENSLICETQERLFVTESNYVERFSRIINMIKASNNPSIENVLPYLTPNDINKLKNDPAIAAEINNIKKEFMKFVNTENLLGDPLNQFDFNQLFKTDDGYGLTKNELVEIFKAQNTLYNPYNNRPFSPNEMYKAYAIPQLNQLIQKSKIQEDSLRPSTIKQLNQLADGLLNSQERESCSDDLPIALEYFVKFNDFYQDLDSQEKRRLDNQWIVPSDGSQKSIKFSDYYPTINQSCVHGAAYALMNMVSNIKPSNEDASTNESRQGFSDPQEVWDGPGRRPRPGQYRLES